MKDQKIPADKRNLTGCVSGNLTAISPTVNRKKGYVVWNCSCVCGNIVLLSTDEFKRYKSCGCLKLKRNKQISATLNFVDGTCVEWLEKRKHRKDNKSGFRGVFFNLKERKFKASIGFKRKRIHLGTFDSFQEAVNARLLAEDKFYKPFLEQYHLTTKR